MSFHAQALAMVGPKPKGDPELMAANAVKLKSVAAEMIEQGRAVAAARVDGSGGGIVSANAATSGNASRIGSAAAMLEAAAATLAAMAATVRTQQLAWERRVAQCEGQLEHEAKRAQAAGR